MNASAAYRCIACGADIVATETSDATRDFVFTAETVLQHHGQMDAACQLVFEALRDDLARVLRARMEAVVRGQIGGTWQAGT